MAAYPALAVQPSAFNPVGVLQAAQGIKASQARNRLLEMQLALAPQQNRIALETARARAEGARTLADLNRFRLGEARERQGALSRFAEGGGFADPSALNTLSRFPDLYSSALTGVNARQQWATMQNARAAQRVASFPDGPERANAWQTELDRALQEGRISPLLHRDLSAQPPTDERLNAIISQAQPMPTDLETARTEALRTQTQAARAAAARRQAMIDRILGGAGAAPVGAPATAPVMAPEAPVAEPVSTSVPGLIESGNIDLANRPVLRNADGSISTIESMNVNIGGREVLIPTIINGRRVTQDQAIEHFRATGEHLGIFDTPENAENFARSLSQRQGQRYGVSGGTLSAPEPAVAPGVSFGAEPAPLPPGVPAIGEGAAAPAEAPRTIGEVFNSASPSEQAEVLSLIQADKIPDAMKRLREISTRGQSPGEMANAERALRNEFRQIAKSYFDVRDAFSRIQSVAAQPSAAGDLALIFNYMKMLDPGSTVREGEFATAQNTTGVPNRVVALYNNILRGERLTPEQRADFLGQSRNLMTSQERQYLNIQRQYGDLAQRLGLRPENVMIDFTAPEATGEGEAEEGTVIRNPQTGQRMILRNGEWQPL